MKLFSFGCQKFREIELLTDRKLFSGTQITLVLKEEAYDYLEQDTVKDLIKKYSQFINFNIFMWTSKTETVDEPIEDEEEDKPEEVNILIGSIIIFLSKIANYGSDNVF